MIGTAGIGYTFLRLHDPEHVPSVLWIGMLIGRVRFPGPEKREQGVDKATPPLEITGENTMVRHRD